MVEPYPLFSDVGAILLVGAVGWIVLLFISRGLAWVCSAFFSLLLAAVLLMHALVSLNEAPPAARLDMLAAAGLCLLVHLVSDTALVVVSARAGRVHAAASAEAAGGNNSHPFRPEPIRSPGD